MSKRPGERRIATIIALLTAAGCSGGSIDDDPLVSLSITPRDAKLETVSSGGKTLQLRATGTFRSGRTESIPAQWQVEDPLLGSINAQGLFTAVGTGGATRVLAQARGQQASTKLTIHLKEELSEGGLGGADLARLVRQPTGDTKRAPAVLYPQGGTMLPPNLPPILIQWTGGDPGNQLFRVRLVCTNADVSWSTTKLSWPPPSRVWSSLTNSCKGGKVDLFLFGTHRTSGPLYLSPATAINIATSPISGTIYYWATGKKGTNKNGIMQIDAGATQSKDYYTQASTGSGRCPGCHAVSRDGSKIVFVEYDAKQTNWIYGLTVKDKKPFVPRDKLVGDFFSFAPQGNRFFASEAGVLKLRSGKDGSVVATVPKWPGVRASHPDWSPTAEELALVVFPESYTDDYRFCQGSIATMPIKAKGPWNHKVIVKSAGAGDHNHYPAFSPDGKQIAFNKIRTQAGQICTLYANLKAKLYLVSRNGGTPVRLDRANGKGDVMDSWPKWAPSAKSSGVWWLAFSSVRDYGRVVENSKYPGLGSGKHPQLWIAAIEVAKIGKGDPSYPAFWLPGQNTVSGNHLPFWTKTLK